MPSEPEFFVSPAGVRTPRILYGTAWKRERTAALVEQALGRGFRGIDTAAQPRHYDEAGVGAGLAAASHTGLRRDALYLQSKFTPAAGQDPRRLPYAAQAPLEEQVEQSFAGSLRNLRTDYLDCLVLHAPLPDAERTLRVWQALEAVAARGGVRQLGISNCYHEEALEWLWQAAQHKPAVVQNRFHAATGYDRTVRAWCRRRQVSYQSFWTLTANPQVLAHATVRSLAARYGRTPVQILFRYLTQIEVVPLTGTTREQHMHEALAIFDFALDDRDREAMNALF